MGGVGAAWPAGWDGRNCGAGRSPHPPTEAESLSAVWRELVKGTPHLFVGALPTGMWISMKQIQNKYCSAYVWFH